MSIYYMIKTISIMRYQQGLKKM